MISRTDKERDSENAKAWYILKSSCMYYNSIWLWANAGIGKKVLRQVVKRNEIIWISPTWDLFYVVLQKKIYKYIYIYNHSIFFILTMIQLQIFLHMFYICQYSETWLCLYDISCSCLNHAISRDKKVKDIILNKNPMTTWNYCL